MQLRRRVALNGVQLDSIDNSIVIQGIDEADGTEDIESVVLYGTGGSRVTSIHRKELSVTVRFSILLRKDRMAEREEVLEKVNAWAYGGGWLTTNYKTNRRIRVFRVQAPGMGDARNWTKEFTILFRACGVPYWQEENPEAVTVQNASSRTISFGVRGSETSVLDFSFRNTSGETINTFSIQTPMSSISFSGLGLANGETLVLDRTDNGKWCLMQIRIRNSGGTWRSAMSKRTESSSNDLTIAPGTHPVSFTAGGAGTITISCNGRFA